MKKNKEMNTVVLVLVALVVSCSSTNTRYNDSSCDDNCLLDAEMMRDECKYEAEEAYSKCLERDPDTSIFGSCGKPIRDKHSLCNKRFCYNKKKCGCPLSMWDKSNCLSLF